MRRKRQRGTSLVEFVLVGIPAIFLIIGVFEMGRAMWNYHTLARAVNAGARLASLRGQDCATGTNSCSVSVATIAATIEQAGIGLRSDTVNVQLTTDSGAVTTCNPLKTCDSSGTTWPPSSSSDNAVGKSVTVSAQYTIHTALSMFWPGAGKVNFGTFTLPATSTQRILF